MAIAKLSMGDSALFVVDGDKLYYREIGAKEDEEVPTPYGVKKWLRLGRAKNGLRRVVGPDGRPDPEIGDGFPTLVAKETMSHEIVYQVKGEKEEKAVEEEE